MDKETDQVSSIESLIQQAIEFVNSGQLVLGEELCLQILNQSPDQSEALFLLGVISYKVGNLEFAIDLLERAIEGQPSNYIIYFNLGICLKDLSLLHRSEVYFRQALSLNPDHAASYYGLGEILLVSNRRIDEASEAFQKAIQLGLKNPDLLLSFGLVLQEQNQTQKAIDFFHELYQVDPNNLAAFLHDQLALPILYETVSDLLSWRARYTRGLYQVREKFRESSLPPQEKLLAFSNCVMPFYLNYQCFNDRELQAQYGDLVNEITTQIYPQASVSSPLTSAPIRIGFLSAHFFFHSVGRACLDWVEGLPHQQFEIHCYHVGWPTDALTERYQSASHHFYHFPQQVDSTVHRVLADQLHILVFLDIGMSPLITQIASLRLSPIQCVRWGHPVTTGLSTIDYYLSSQLMEPENGQQHYSEQLILIPGLGKALRDSPDLTYSRTDRSMFGFSEDLVLFLSPQSLMKYLPQYDHIYPQIVQQVPQAQIVFMARAGSQQVIDQFWERMRRAFSQYFLNVDDFCVIIPKLKYPDFLSLNLSCDIFLDNFGWSGDNTALDAVACGLPLITCPGQLMRERHAAGILEFLGVTETIAQDETGYIELATKLGQDPHLRVQISEKIRYHHQRLLGDRRHIDFLADFYQQAVRQYPAKVDSSLSRRRA